MRKNVVDIFLVTDNSLLETYHLKESEIYAIWSCPINDLIRAHTEKNYSFEVSGLTSQKDKITIKVSQKSFSYNWDHYHFKISLLAKRYTNGENNLIY